MTPPIAFTYEADVHCPAHTFERFGRATVHSFAFNTDFTQPWPPDDARDREGNAVGAIASWDEWCLACQDNEPDPSAGHGLYCADDGELIASCWLMKRDLVAVAP